MGSDLIQYIPDRAAERDPDAIAFRAMADALSFADLVTRAGQLACVLTDRGVRPGDRVGLFVRKSLISAVGIYGIARAGSVYVPLDPAAPPERLAQIIARCGISHIVTDTPMQAAVTRLLPLAPTIAHVIGLPGHLGASWDEVAQASVAGPYQGSESDPAYIMFTSGSTGVPKGMVHTHRSGLAYARAATGLYGVSPEDVMANHSALHFDMSTFAMFGGPMTGAQVVMVPDAIARLPAEMSKLMQDARISVWYSVPYALTQLLDAGALEARDLSALRWIIYAGEPFVPQQLRSLMRRLPAAQVSNNYGPAEVNVCTYHHIASPDDISDDGVPIGRVWDIATGLIVDEDDRDVPTGARGELLIASDTQMQGYWDAPDLDARSFFHRDGTRFYRTGDLVEDIGGGVLRYFGRKDRQIKVRGFRIELSEVELALSGHEAVVEAVAFAAPEGSGLMAAVTVRSSPTAVAADILAKARNILPPYAVPVKVIVVDNFARTATGKINHKAVVAAVTASF